MTVNIIEGYANIQGAVAFEEFARTLNIEASSNLDRIDRIVLRLNDNIDARKIDLYVIKGDAEQNPKPPALIRSDSVYDLSLATIYINSNSTSITQSKITDTRLDSNVCGIVAQAVNGIDTSELYKQMTDDLKELEIAISEAKILQLVDGAVSTSKIVDGAVTTSKIANKSIEFEKLNEDLQSVVHFQHSKIKKWTGKYDSDGKKIYSKKIEFSFEQEGRTVLVHNLGIHNYLSVNGYCRVYKTLTDRPVPFINETLQQLSIQMLNENNIDVYSSFTGNLLFLNIEYTEKG